MMNKAALSNNLVLLVTHLARETLPHIKLPIRVDGIEASGFDPKTGELVVDRQPKFNHIGSTLHNTLYTSFQGRALPRAVSELYTLRYWKLLDRIRVFPFRLRYPFLG